MDINIWISFFGIILLNVVLFCSVTKADEFLDSREGENVVLKCRFNEQQSFKEFSYYWARWTNAAKFENVAISGIQLNTGYRLDFRPKRGIYDLQITNVSYARDNGRFECRVKAVGTGADVHQENYNLTVLTPPKPPLVAPGSIVVATENKKQDLTCTSIGGSPDPTIVWYRDDSTTPLEAPVRYGGSRDLQITSTLSVTPSREDDGAKYKCVVWNRAMLDDQRLETIVTLSVNYFPRVDVGPENPLRVERDSTAKLECKVDAKPKVSNVRWTRNGRFISSSMTYTIHRVSLQDTGKYTCTAENGLGKMGEQEILLDVLYPPVVVIESKIREAEERETIHIKCNVTSNPPAVSVEWLKEGSPEFRFIGEVLTIQNVRAENGGTYICRAMNMIKAFGQKVVERVGNASIALLIRHRPGKAVINPSQPLVHVGNGVTLTCSANPPGWPVPQFRWFRDDDGEISTQTILAQGSQYVIPRAHLGSEGRYHCHAANELGIGEMATVTLEVHQPPQFLAKLQQHMIKRVGDSDYAVTCSAKGKPKPTIEWFKDGKEILDDSELYEIKTNPVEGPNGMVTVQSRLKFTGSKRPQKNQLMPDDRGLYTCLYENEVNAANSSMQLRIEHEPIVLHQYNKVAYDLKDTAEVMCKVQANPKPEFQWQFGTNTVPLTASSDGHYEIVTSSDNNDVFTSVLRIQNLKQSDYGEYSCRAANSLETIRAPIRLQPKGQPEKPLNLQAADVGANYVTLLWDPGFDGGLSNTKFFVAYKKVTLPQGATPNADCGEIITSTSNWQEFDCHRNTQCNITPLDQHQSYVFKVKALNTKGNSEYSNDIATTTKVNKISPPLHATFDPMTRVLGINVAATCLALIAVVESVIYGNTPMAAWQVVDTVQLQVSGSEPIYKESIIDELVKARKSSARSYGDNELPFAFDDELNPRVRVKLCLKGNHEHCSDYTEADIGPSYDQETYMLATPTLIAIVISCVVFSLFIALLLMFCRCKRRTKKNSPPKKHEIDSDCPSIVAQQNQAPPPYYPASSLDNKSKLMDLVMTLEDHKSSVYATQNGYDYHTSDYHSAHVPGHTVPDKEWDNMGYMENNYANSNNGGSLNSQDSLWQLKMGGQQQQQQQQQQMQQQQLQQQMPQTYLEHQPTYGYDPMTHGGYGTIDDYAPYPHLTTISTLPHDDAYHIMGNGDHRSRQELYCGDSYASVQKPKKQLDQHLDLAYHDANSLPDPYADMPDDQNLSPTQNMAFRYEENSESGFSTPSAKNRRVIHEIVV